MCAECPDWQYRSWTHNYWKSLSRADSSREAAFTQLDENDMEGQPLIHREAG